MVNIPYACACRNDFYNTANGVVITIYAKGVAAEDLEIEYGEQMVRHLELRYDECKVHVTKV